MHKHSSPALEGEPIESPPRLHGVLGLGVERDWKESLGEWKIPHYTAAAAVPHGGGFLGNVFFHLKVEQVQMHCLQMWTGKWVAFWKELQFRNFERMDVSEER